MPQISPVERQLLRNFIARNTAVAPLDLDEGIGTVFERRMIDAYLRHLMDDRGVQTVLETPADGVTGVPGINSLEFARRGGQVTLANPVPAMLDKAAEVWVRQGLRQQAEFRHAECDALPFEDNTFDLVWNFCMFERFDPPDTVLGEMARVARGYVLIMNQNYRNWGTPVHKLYHQLADLEWDHGYIPLMSLDAIVAAMERQGLEVVERGTIDSPPWMDTWDMPMRGFLKSWLSVLGVNWEWRSRPKAAAADGGGNGAAAGTASAPRSAQARALDLFEWIERNLPEWFARSQTHHFYALGRKVG
jgi:SAM-dependent methyltransferase